jgi:hypothetical protein
LAGLDTLKPHPQFVGVVGGFDTDLRLDHLRFDQFVEAFGEALHAVGFVGFDQLWQLAVAFFEQEFSGRGAVEQHIDCRHAVDALGDARQEALADNSSQVQRQAVAGALAAFGQEQVHDTPDRLG